MLLGLLQQPKKTENERERKEEVGFPKEESTSVEILM